MKPFQAIPLVRERVLASLGLGDVELAVACASHHGMPLHVDAVRRILRAVGAGEDDLACGPHRPVDEDAALALDRDGKPPERIHNNCSGKHAAMIASAIAAGWDSVGYHEFDHPVQERIRETLGEWIGPDPGGLRWGIDGCGVPTPRLPLSEMAEAYARFFTSRDPAATAVAAAMRRNPNMVSGPTALSASLMTATNGRLLAKEGAEGVFCLGDPEEGWAAAFKVRDGAMRALGPAVVRVLDTLDLASEGEMDELQGFREIMISNTRGEAVAVLTAGPTDG
jgi:L-asparaginase II